MRGAFFQQPLEYQIEVEGESWEQGEVVKGLLRVRNMSSEAVSVKTPQIILAHGLKKDIKETAEVTWEVVGKQIATQEISLQAAGEQTFEWSFILPTDSPITDKQGGLYLLFGGEEALTIGGRLNLQINLHPILQNFLQTFTTQFRFLEKYQKRKSEWTEILDKHDIPTAPVNDIREVYSDPQVQAREMVQSYDHPGLGEVKYTPSPMKFSEWKFRNLPTPELGEHTMEILVDRLGYNAQEVDRLERNGVLVCSPKEVGQC